MTTKDKLTKLHWTLQLAAELTKQLQTLSSDRENLMEDSLEALDSLSASVSDAEDHMKNICKIEGMKWKEKKG